MSATVRTNHDVTFPLNKNGSDSSKLRASHHHQNTSTGENTQTVQEIESVLVPHTPSYTNRFYLSNSDKGKTLLDIIQGRELSVCDSEDNSSNVSLLDTLMSHTGCCFVNDIKWDFPISPEITDRVRECPKVS
ncbi:hypothetical protein RRG08_057552 [Elysia crispata]|uniref:Uncharacterized protein n=1 Tax=Elysia crispata TaxID=231223 RepID=A0AAE0XPG5_9GAST|nr:hypothetical protein RRG08_057552 [Elysia crispata]